MKIRTMLGVAATAVVVAIGVLPPAGASATAGTAAAPTAPGATVVSVSATDGTTTAVSRHRTRSKSEGSGALAGSEVAARAATCYDGFVSGPDFYVTCTGDAEGYRLYIDCSDGFRYYFDPLYVGTWEHVLTCPAGTLAVWGGWWL
ncbi:hypothetical protein [Sphaerisporangium aureirubrum]|uniref:Chitin-binding type-2 domain-containing protein n=1 Tax=Sphaerisporangium aureirubrum TaxID=1544736 RepID=A0ABW1NSB6_9ACTN